MENKNLIKQLIKGATDRTMLHTDVGNEIIDELNKNWVVITPQNQGVAVFREADNRITLDLSNLTLGGETGATGLTGQTGSTGEAGQAGVIGLDGVAGATGATGPASMVGWQGPTGDAGPTGVSGSQGAQGETGATGPLGDTGPQGETGPAGVDGPPDKTAIVHSSIGPIALSCVESPEVRFEDVMVIESPSNGAHPIDPLFIEVCEPESIVVFAQYSAEGCCVAIHVSRGFVHLCFNDETPKSLTISLSGIRNGFAGERFARHTEEEMNRNNAFWSRAL